MQVISATTSEQLRALSLSGGMAPGVDGQDQAEEPVSHLHTPPTSTVGGDRLAPSGGNISNFCG